MSISQQLIQQAKKRLEDAKQHEEQCRLLQGITVTHTYYKHAIQWTKTCENTLARTIEEWGEGSIMDLTYRLEHLKKLYETTKSEIEVITNKIKEMAKS